MSPELRELGDTLSRLKEVRTTYDGLGIGMDIRRVGAAGSIFHLKCLAVKCHEVNYQESAFRGAQLQLNTLCRAIDRVQLHDETPDMVRLLVVEIFRKSWLALASAAPTTFRHSGTTQTAPN